MLRHAVPPAMRQRQHCRAAFVQPMPRFWAQQDYAVSGQPTSYDASRHGLLAIILITPL